MSSFIVELSSIEKIICGIDQLSKVETFRSICEEFLSELAYSYNISDSLTCEKYFKKECALFLAFNQVAVDTVNPTYEKAQTRFRVITCNKGWESQFKRNDIDFKIKWDCEKCMYEFDRKEVMQYLKSLECYLYQCCEGELFNTSLYQILKFLRNQLYDFIVSNDYDYVQASWA